MITVIYDAAKALAESLGNQMPRCELTWTSNFNLSFIRHPVPGEYHAPTFCELVRGVLPKLLMKLPCQHDDPREKLWYALKDGGMESVSAAVIELCKEGGEA